jgi:hypothetical protein
MAIQPTKALVVADTDAGRQHYPTYRSFLIDNSVCHFFIYHFFGFGFEFGFDFGFSFSFSFDECF